jgi:hypothetical protein
VFAAMSLADYGFPLAIRVSRSALVHLVTISPGVLHLYPETRRFIPFGITTAGFLAAYASGFLAAQTTLPAR